MPVPKRKRSRARRDKRFANKGIAPKPFVMCKQCSDPVALMPHQACRVCGYYKGVKVLATKADRQVKRDETRKVKQAQKQAQQPASESQSAE